MATTIPVREALLAAARAELVEHGSAGISLRAVARRAGVSHAAPKYHFADRAGLLTAVAVEGFAALAAALEPEIGDTEAEADPVRWLATLGRAYVDFGLTQPALFDLMFRPAELHPDNPDLVAAQTAAISGLRAAVAQLAPPDESPGRAASPPLALVSWAFVHGLVALARDGALQAAAGTPRDHGRNLTHALTGVFADALGRRAGTAADGAASCQGAD